MSKTKYILLLVFLWLPAVNIMAGADIGFGAVVLSADTLHPADTLLINTALINYGPQDFDGPVGFDYAINGVQNISRSIFDAPLAGQSIHIPAGGNYPLQFQVVLQNQYFEVGSDIFVVWPILPNGSIVKDTMQAQIYIAGPAGVTDNDDSGQLRIYTSADAVTIYSPEYVENAVMRIYDITGKQVHTGPLKDGKPVPFYNEAPGIYLLEVSFNNGHRRVFKVVKQ